MDNNFKCERVSKRIQKRRDRAALHQKRKESGYQGDYAPCDLCGGQASWCSICETYTSNCCVDYGTCMCS